MFKKQVRSVSERTKGIQEEDRIGVLVFGAGPIFGLATI